ncbi:hypothetical protein [Streptomyces thermoalcalitolerans]|uniref:MFS transporter n=1 Tax=Streptomyces thermoalcalitolerans TaxID=65605 RepID=A0ABN1P4L5_9ACTN
MPSLAAATSWRTTLARPRRPRRPGHRRSSRPAAAPRPAPGAHRQNPHAARARPNRAARRLIVYSLGVGTGLAALNTYLPLHAHEELGLGERASGALIAAVGVVRGTAFGATGHASALVSMGFFGGFVVGPLGFGLIADSPAGYLGGWALAGGAFLMSVLSALMVRRAVTA